MAAFDVRAARQRANGMLNGFTTGQKAMMGLAVGGVVVGLFVFTRMGSSPTMAALYNNLQATDASSITQELTAQHVPYKLTDGGATIMVPQDQVYPMRLSLAAKNLPTGGKDGYSLLDNQGITTSQFVQRVDYQRALAGELARTIEAYKAVDTAMVNLTMPTADVFALDDKKATAAVVLKTASGASLDEQQITSIVNLVAMGVPNLATTSITVADTDGHLLWSPGDKGGIGAGVAAGTNSKTLQFEATLKEQLQALLDPIVGVGKSTVKVAADLDFDERESQSTRYEAAGAANGTPLLDSRATQNEQYAGSTPNATGVLGTDLQPTNGSVPANATQYTNTQDTSKFANNQITEAVKTAPGKINKLSIAVALDAGNPLAKDAATVDKIKNLITQGAGLDIQNRGDTLAVESIAFTKAPTITVPPVTNTQAMTDYLRIGGAVLIVLLVLFFSWRSLKKAAKKAAVATPIDVRELEMVRDELREILPGGATAESLDAAEEALEALPPVPVSASVKRAEQLEVEISDLIEKQPDEVAAVLRSWLAERRSVRR